MKIITYGTFDLFHYGHYSLLKRAAELGNELYVGISSDEMCRKKGKEPILSELSRCEIVRDLRFVDHVFIEHNMAQKVNDVVRLQIDIFVLGDDYKDIFVKMPEYDTLINLGCKVMFLPRTPDMSTTTLKSKLYKQMILDKNHDSLHYQTNSQYDK